MNKTLYIGLALVFGVAGAKAQTTVMDGQVEVSNIDVTRSSGNVYVSMDLDVARLEMKKNREVILTPELRDTEGNVRSLPDIWLVGRNRYYYHLRNDSIAEGRFFYRKSKVSSIRYEASVPYEAWMRYADLMMSEDVCGCSDLLLTGDELLRGSFVPLYAYVQPPVEKVKVREVKGSAFIDFPVNETVIYPDYRNNPAELEKIRQTIGVVKNDSDAQITSVSIKGFASPESPYDNNTRLAKGRTQALKEYVQRLYHLSPSVFTTSWEPEDWEGLRKYVEASALDDKDEILKWIAKDMDPDQKEWAIRSRHPQSYTYLLKNCYPALRHSDYVVEYVVRSYADIDEAKRVYKTSPGKLSLHELYLVASDYEQGSEEYNELFETMVRLYPDDEVANLNAANVAMSKEDMKAARKYLDKAGSRPEAEYARGLLLAMEGDYEAARPYIEKAKAGGVKEADECLKRIDRLTVKEK